VKASGKGSSEHAAIERGWGYLRVCLCLDVGGGWYR
jgi:hypothetical protein